MAPNQKSVATYLFLGLLLSLILVSCEASNNNKVWEIVKVEVLEISNNDLEENAQWVAVDEKEIESGIKYLTDYQLSNLDQQELDIVGDTIIWVKYADESEFQRGQKHARVSLVKINIE